MYQVTHRPLRAHENKWRFTSPGDQVKLVPGAYVSFSGRPSDVTAILNLSYSIGAYDRDEYECLIAKLNTIPWQSVDQFEVAHELLDEVVERLNEANADPDFCWGISNDELFYEPFMWWEEDEFYAWLSTLPVDGSIES